MIAYIVPSGRSSSVGIATVIESASSCRSSGCCVQAASTRVSSAPPATKPWSRSLCHGLDRSSAP